MSKNLKNAKEVFESYLQSVFEIGEESFLMEISREKSESVFNVLKKVFQGKVDEKVIRAFDRTDVDLDELMLWIEENIPKEYKGEALARAYLSLATADKFRGRIYRQQFWRFLQYQNIFQTAGIAYAKPFSKAGFTERSTNIFSTWPKCHKRYETNSFDSIVRPKVVSAKVRRSGRPI